MSGFAAGDGWECQQLLVKLAYMIDHGEPGGLASVFTETPVMRVFGRDVEGIAAIGGMFEQLTKSGVVRHCLSPAIIEAAAAGAIGRSYATVFKVDQHAGDGPAPLDGVAMVVDYVDSFVRGDDGWRIARHEIEMIFRR